MNHLPVDVKPAEYIRVTYTHTVAQGNDFEKDVLNPDYWTHLANKLRAGDRIEIQAHDGSYFAEVVVAAVYSRAVAVAVVFKTNTKKNEIFDNPEYVIKFRGPRKWSVVRVKDSAIIKEDIATELDAVRERDDYLKALAA